MSTDRPPASPFPSLRDHRGRRGLAVLLAGAALLPSAVRSVDRSVLAIDRIDGPAWSAEGIRIEVDLGARPLSGHLYAQRIRLAGAAQQLQDLRVDCHRLDLAGGEIACRDARIAGLLGALGRQAARGSLVYERGSGRVDLDLRGLGLGDGTFDLTATLAAPGWRAATRLDAVPVAAVAATARQFGLEAVAQFASGRLSGQLEVQGPAGRLSGVAAALAVQELTAANADGTVASETLGVALRGHAELEEGTWNFAVDLGVDQGQAYVEPVFVDFSAHRLRLDAVGRLVDEGVRIERFELRQDGVLDAAGAAALAHAAGARLTGLELEIRQAMLPEAYTTYLQPYLVGTSLQSLEMAGTVNARLKVENSALVQLAVRLDGLNASDSTAGLALGNVTGEVFWRQSPTGLTDDGDLEAAAADAGLASVSRLAWTEGSFYGLALGAGSLAFSSEARNFRLLEPARIPLVDGAIAIDRLRVRNAGAAGMAFVFDANVEPLSIRELCRAFGWPEFGGRLAGRISRLRMREGIVTLGTSLEAEVFDGRIRLRDLRLEDPLGHWPRFHSSIDIERLDLEQVTSAFSFGRITGRLSGQIEGLELFNWTPVAFDARLYTPPDDRSRHRISQRAVENIGSLGGSGAGVRAALSSGFLRFFEDFNYDRLGISCRLENEVCYMNGVEPAEGDAYYLVKGKGLPRINVIGNNRRVDWPRLVAQLRAIIESEGPVVE